MSRVRLLHQADAALRDALLADGWLCSLDELSAVCPATGFYYRPVREGWCAVLHAAVHSSQSRRPGVVAQCYGSYRCALAELLLAAVDAPGPNLDVEWNEPRDVEDLVSVEIEDAEALIAGLDQVVCYGHHVLAWAQEHASLEDWVSQRRLDNRHDYATLQLAGVQTALNVPDAVRARSRAIALSDPDCAAAAGRLQGFVDSGRKMPQTVANLPTVPPDIHRSPELVSVAPARLFGPAGLFRMARSARRVARWDGIAGPWRRRPD